MSLLKCRPDLSVSQHIQALGANKGVWPDSLGLVCVAGGDKKEGSLPCGFPQNHCVPKPPIAQTRVSVFSVRQCSEKKGDDRLRTPKTEGKTPRAGSTAFNRPHIDRLTELPQLVLKSMLAPLHLL